MIECAKCKLKYPFIKDKLCDFCDIVYNLNKYHTYKYVICYSKITQEDIIKKTYEYIIKNDIVPIPSDIDKDSIIISVNPYIFASHIKNNNYKIFFTNCIDKNNIKIKRIGSRFQNEKFDINKFSGFDLKKIDENIYNDYTNIINIYI